MANVMITDQMYNETKQRFFDAVNVYLDRVDDFGEWVMENRGFEGVIQPVGFHQKTGLQLDAVPFPRLIVDSFDYARDLFEQVVQMGEQHYISLEDKKKRMSHTLPVNLAMKLSMGGGRMFSQLKEFYDIVRKDGEPSLEQIFDKPYDMYADEQDETHIVYYYMM
jgi:hypothetical protein